MSYMFAQRRMPNRYVKHVRRSVATFSPGMEGRRSPDWILGALSSGHKFVEISDRFMPAISLPAGRYCGEYLHPRTPNNLYVDFISRSIRMLTRPVSHEVVLFLVRCYLLIRLRIRKTSFERDEALFETEHRGISFLITRCSSPQISRIPGNGALLLLTRDRHALLNKPRTCTNTN